MKKDVFVKKSKIHGMKCTPKSGHESARFLGYRSVRAFLLIETLQEVKLSCNGSPKS